MVATPKAGAGIKDVRHTRPEKQMRAAKWGRLVLGFVLGPWLVAAGAETASAQAPLPGPGPSFGPLPAITSTSQIPPPQFGDPGQMARAKLRQARTLMEQGRFDDAARLAGEANAWTVQYGPSEDTPTRLLDEINRSKKDAKFLLTAARKALVNNELDRAETLAKAAQQAQPAWSPTLFGDSPGKVLNEIKAARGPMPKAGTPAPADSPKGSAGARSLFGARKDDAAATASPANQREAARKLLRDARAALAQGDVAKARELHQKILEMKADLAFWEDNPDKLLADINKHPAAAVNKKPANLGLLGQDKTSLLGEAGSSTARPAGRDGAADKVVQTGHSQAGSATKSTAPSAKIDTAIADPRTLLRQGRDLFKQGKLDEAARAAQQAKNKATTSWGLFEDNPDKLLRDVERARTQNDQEEAAKLLAEGRKLLAEGKLDQAHSLACKAEKKHGPYSIWDLGDRPQKLLADIQTARDKQRKVNVPPVPGVATADKGKKPETKIGPTGDPVAQTPRSSPTGPAAPTGSGMPFPGVGQPLAGPAPTPGPGSGVPVGYQQVAPTDPRKQQAQMLLTQARQFQQMGRLPEARQRALEAHGIGAAFGPNEDSPDQALLQLNSLCYKRVDALVQQAADFLTVAADPDRFRKAEENLMQARQLAAIFGQDVQPVDARIAHLKQMHAQQQAMQAPQAAPAATAVPAPNPGPSAPGFAHVAGGTPPPVPAAPPAGPAVVPPAAAAAMMRPAAGAAPAGSPGAQMLEQARQLLRSGKTLEARKLAEDAFQGPYGVQPQAEALLRTIDAEEFGQQKITAQKAFEAGNRALNRRDYATAVALFRGLNVRLLDKDKQIWLNDVLSRPEMRAFTGQDAGRAQASDQQPGAMTGPAPSGVAAVSGTTDLLKSTQAMQDIKFQQLRQQGLEAQREAAARFKSGDTDGALEILEGYLADINSVQLEADRLALLKRPVDARLMQFKTLKQQRDYEAGILNAQKGARNIEGQLALMEANKQKQVAELMGRNKQAYEEGKYREALSYAHTALELDPDNAAAAAAIKMANMQLGLRKVKDLRNEREKLVDGALDDAESEGPYVGIDEPMKFDGDHTRKIAEMRKPLAGGITIGQKSEKEREIEHRLQAPVNLNFNDTPLDQVLEDLHSYHGINIVPDYKALETEGISLKRPVTIKLSNVSLKSALNLILKQLNLTYVIADEVLQITTERHAHGKLVTRTFPVADLVIPVENFYGPPANSLQATLDARAQQSVSPGTPGPQPFRSPTGLQGGQPVGPFSPGSSGGPPSQFGSEPGRSTVGTTAGINKPIPTMEEALIKLITSTVAPQSWAELGGQGTIEYFPLTMALVVNQTVDIQEQVLELLTALRRLQEQEVAIEVRFVAIAEAFFERIGVDFNINIKTDHETARFEPQLVSGQFKPAGYINDFNPSKLLVGLTPGGTFTSDLDIPIQLSSFDLAIPPFGGWPTGAIADGGIQLGLAFLSDIQVFLFLEAAQGDRRTNIMQAPKLTMYNGQTATINVIDQQFFVTSITGIQNGGQFIFLPQNQPLPLGVQLTLQPVISADRRFVRLSLGPTFTNLTSATVPLFPIVLSAQPFFEGVGNVGAPILLTQFVQQPTFSTITVQTTVTVPDGGTVLLGGFKRLSEGRNEFGPPVLSKIPYINRLFKNVGYGREAESLMIMVTPRIIIQSEEEFRATGVGAP